MNPAQVNGIIVIVVSLVIGLLAMNIVINWMKSHRLRVRHPINKSNYVKDYWVREKKDRKSGTLFWVSVWWQPKFKVEMPPESAIDIGVRGKKHAECYWVSEEQYLWIGDKGIKVEEVDVMGTKDGKDVVVGKKKVIKDIDTGETIDNFKPLTQTQREVVINQWKKAAEISKGKWTPEKIVMMAGMGILGFVVIIAFVFGGEVMTAWKSARATDITILEKIDDITGKQALLINSLGIKIDNYEVVIAQTPETQTGTTIITDGETPPQEENG